MDQSNPTSPTPPPVPGPVTAPPASTPAAPTPPPVQTTQPQAAAGTTVAPVSAPSGDKHTPIWAKALIAILILVIIAELLFIFRSNIPGLSGL